MIHRKQHAVASKQDDDIFVNDDELSEESTVPEVPEEAGADGENESLAEPLSSEDEPEAEQY